MVPEGSSKDPFLHWKEKRNDQIPVWPRQQGKHDEQIPIWLSLVKALNDARDQLHGDDLELFERLISRRRKPAEVQDLIFKWRNGELGTFSRLREEAAKPFDPFG
jgi:hypothetical protein